MPNTTVTLVRYCRTENGWKRYPVAYGKNGRVRPEYVLIDGKQVHCPVGHYELRFYEGRKLRYENVGDNAGTAFTKKLAKEKLLAAQTAAQDAGVKIVEDHSARKYLRRQANLYIQDRKNQGALEAARQAEGVTEHFIASSGKTYIDEVTKDDVYDYLASLRKQGNSDRTVANKYARLRSFLRYAGLDIKNVMPDKPKYEKTLPTVYTSEQITALLAVADDYMRLVIELGLKCGLREQEMMYLEWADIHESDKVLRVQGKPDWDFKVKDSEQRDVPIPDDLLKHLKAWREKQHKKHPKSRLVLGTSNGQPNGHLLRLLKRLAKSAGLNCGVCDGCKGEVKECQQFTLHKLRRMYATTLLRNGIDLRTVQHFMGHADLASTIRYLRPAGSTETQSAISNIFSGF
jgi:integrase